MLVVPAMAAVHEDMHQRAGQQKQERQGTEEMGAVLAEQKVGGSGTKDDQADGVA